MAIGTTAAILGGLAIAGTAFGASKASSASKAASDTQYKADMQALQVQRESMAQQERLNKEGMDFQKGIYEQSRTDSAPYRDIGNNALAALADAIGIPRGNALANASGGAGFQKSPGYEFAFDEGMRAVNASQSARRMWKSGATDKALIRFGQGTANQEFGNYLSRLSGVAGMGQNAGQNALSAYGTAGANLNNNLGANIGVNAANTGNLLQSAGASRASGYVGSANALNQGIGSGVNNLLALYGMSQGGGTAGYGGYASGYAPFYSQAAAAGY